MKKRKLSMGAVSAMVIVAGLAGSIQAQEKANTVIILGDDVGWFRISAYISGMLGNQTTNIDRIAREGVQFTDWYSP